MSEIVQFRLRALRAGLSLALLGLVSHSAVAQNTSPAPAGDSVTVTREADGTLRPATVAEQAALEQLKSQARSNARVAAPSVQQKVHGVSGARGVRLTDEFLSASTVVRKADGSLDMQCLEAHGGANAVPHTHSAPSDTE